MIKQENINNIIAMMKEDAAKYKDDGFSNLADLISSLRIHAAVFGWDKIERKDRPKQLKLAFECKETGKTWSIYLSKLKGLSKLKDEAEIEPELLSLFRIKKL